MRRTRAVNKYKLINANLTGCDLRVFVGTVLKIDFSGSDLRNADFAMGFLEQFRFAGADLRDANFSFASLVRAILIEILPNGLPKGDFRGADLTDARIDVLLVLKAKICTEVGLLPQTVTTPEGFVAYARESGMKIDGMTGRPRCEGDWRGVFRQYERR